jgi:hypothetical protein
VPVDFCISTASGDKFITVTEEHTLVFEVIDRFGNKRVVQEQAYISAQAAAPLLTGMQRKVSVDPKTQLLDGTVFRSVNGRNDVWVKLHHNEASNAHVCFVEPRSVPPPSARPLHAQGFGFLGMGSKIASKCPYAEISKSRFLESSGVETGSPVGISGVETGSLKSIVGISVSESVSIDKRKSLLSEISGETGSPVGKSGVETGSPGSDLGVETGSPHMDVGIGTHNWLVSEFSGLETGSLVGNSGVETGSPTMDVDKSVVGSSVCISDHRKFVVGSGVGTKSHVVPVFSLESATWTGEAGGLHTHTKMVFGASYPPTIGG